MTNRLRMILALALGVALAGPAAAYDSRSDGAYYDYAKVVRVEPVSRIVRVSEPRRDCWEEPVTRYRRHARHGGDSYTPSILGGILGGVVGNQFGSGSGRDVMTVAGTVLGASIGRDTQRAGRYHSESYTTTEVRCETRNDYREVERPDGYRVTYRYRDEVFVRHMDHDPGERVRVRISVQPVDYDY